MRNYKRGDHHISEISKRLNDVSCISRGMTTKPIASLPKICPNERKITLLSVAGKYYTRKRNICGNPFNDSVVLRNRRDISPPVLNYPLQPRYPLDIAREQKRLLSLFYQFQTRCKSTHIMKRSRSVQTRSHGRFQ